MDVTSEVRDGVGIIAVAGEVDSSNAAELRDIFLSVLGEAPRSLVLDLAELTFIDSSGLGALISANREASAKLKARAKRSTRCATLSLRSNALPG